MGDIDIITDKLYFEMQDPDVKCRRREFASPSDTTEGGWIRRGAQQAELGIANARRKKSLEYSASVCRQS